MELELGLLEALDGLLEGLGLLAVEEHAGRGVGGIAGLAARRAAGAPGGLLVAGQGAHAVEYAACAIGDHRPSGRLGFDRDQPEVLPLRMDQRTTPPIKSSELRVVHPTHELDVAGRAALEGAPAGSVADHHEAPARAAEAFEGDVVPLVGDEPADEQEEIVGGLPRGLDPAAP